MLDCSGQLELPERRRVFREGMMHYFPSRAPV